MVRAHVLFAVVACAVLFAGCAAPAAQPTVKGIVAANQLYVAFSNAHVDTTELDEAIPVERFAELETGKYCLDEIPSAAYHRYRIASGSSGAFFIVSDAPAIVCIYRIDGESVKPCDGGTCGTREELFLQKIIANSALKERNVYRKNRESMDMTFRIKGQDYVKYMNGVKPGLGDEMERAMQSIFPKEPFTTEYYELGKKAKTETTFPLPALDITGFTAINSGNGEQQLCIRKKASGGMYCGDPEAFKTLNVTDFTGLYSDVFDSRALQNPDISVAYERRDDGKECLIVSTVDYDARHDIYSETSSQHVFESMSDLLGNESAEPEKFSYAHTVCMAGDLITDENVHLEMITSVVAFTISSESVNEELRIDVVSDADFQAPPGAVTACKTTCAERTCMTWECSPMTTYSCSYDPIKDCCGNGVCEEDLPGTIESYKSCQADCPGFSLREGFTDREVQNYIAKTFLKGKAAPGVFTNARNDERINVYEHMVANGYLTHQKYGVFATFEAFDERRGSYARALQDYQFNGINSNSNIDYFKGQANWTYWIETRRDATIEYVYRDIREFCADGAKGYTQISGEARIYVKGHYTGAENVKDSIVWFEFGPCATEEDVRQIIDDELAWLTTPDATNGYKLWRLEEQR